MKSQKVQESGFSLIEFMIAMTITLVLLGVVSTLMSGAMSVRARESAKTDALTSAQAAINVLSREIGNAGFGLTNNGIVAADSNANQIHFRSNITNNDMVTLSPGEDITYYFDPSTQSIVRHDRNAGTTTSTVVNGISNVSFQYFNYVNGSTTVTQVPTPDADTGRVRVTVTVNLPDVQGQPTNQFVRYVTDVTLRNATYMRKRY